MRDRLIKRIDTIGTGSNQTTRAIEYGYDVAGNKTWTKTASGTTTYTYDERNRLDTVLQNGVLQADYAYDAINNLTSTKLGNGTEEVREYDLLNRLKSLENRKLTAAGTVESVISRFDYTLDKVGNRTKVAELSGRSMTYTYDDLYRLTKEVIDETGTIDDRTIEYVYDRVGNRLQKQETLNGVTTQTEYDYDANDRLLWEKVNGVTTTTYTYDDNGSTRTKTENGVTTTYTWNDDKRLIGATVTDAEGRIQQQLQYRYNDDGIRVASVANGQETRYLLDEVQAYAQVLEEYAPNGAVQVSYVYGNDLISQTQGGQTTYYHVDGLGSTTELTDTTGTVVSRSRYDAFGSEVKSEGAINNKYLFAGEQFDSNLGDYYLRQRYYNPTSGAFTRRDTYDGRLKEPLSLQKYIYAHGNPVNGTDPSGLSLVSEQLVILQMLADLAAIGIGLYALTRTRDYKPEALGGFWQEAPVPTNHTGHTSYGPDPISVEPGFWLGENLGAEKPLVHIGISNLVLSVFAVQGSAATTLPNLTNKPRPEAEQSLQDAGFIDMGSTASGDYAKWYHPDGSRVFIHRSGQVKRAGPKVKPSDGGKSYRPRIDQYGRVIPQNLSGTEHETGEIIQLGS